MATKPKKTKKTVEPAAQLQVDYLFPTPVYYVMKTEYLDTARTVADEYIKKAAEANPIIDEIYPVQMTDSFYDDPRIKDLSDYILNVAWDVLNEQGYNMTNLRTFYNEFWCQDHQKHSAMEQHAHGYGAQIVGFYFLDCPANCSKVLFHDPKIAKVQINLPETDMSKATTASNIINYEAKPGQLMLTNAWLAHSFTRSAAAESMRFIHFTITPYPAPQVNINPVATADAAEII
jgi:hypothetical protein